MVQLFDLLTQPLQAQRLIPVLTAFLLRRHNDTRGYMLQPNRAFRLVHMLTAGPTGAKGLDLALTQQVFVCFRQYNH